MGIQEQTSLATPHHYAGWNHHERTRCIRHLCVHIDGMGRKEDPYCVHEIWSACGG